MAKQINIEYAEKLHPVFSIQKRIKIVVGGRASTKSTGVADYVAARISQGELWCCARENQNSIEESVHRTILDEISRLELPGFDDTKTSILHSESGGRTFYRGLSRNITSIKSMLSGVDGLWIEEGEGISEDSLRVLTASLRLNAKDTQRLMAGEDVKMPEIIITMNRGSREDPVAKKWLERAEPELERCGYYEDDVLMVVQVNYTDIPSEWFLASGLEAERLDDKKRMSAAMYDHKWNGLYLEAVDNPLISPEWFDACIDAHKNLGFKPLGLRYSSHDPSDNGPDSKGFAFRHGSVVLDVQENTEGDINEGGDWAAGLAINHQSDAFTWDCDGMGVGLNAQVNMAFQGKQTVLSQFKGSEGVDLPDAVYEPAEGTPVQFQKTNKEALKNKRAQYYLELRRRIYKTYRAVVHEEYHDPDELLSFDSSIQCLNKLRSELCRMPIKPNSNGLFELYTKQVMKDKFKLNSPNLADSVMMLMKTPNTQLNQYTYTPKPMRSRSYR